MKKIIVALLLFSTLADPRIGSAQDPVSAELSVTQAAIRTAMRKFEETRPDSSTVTTPDYVAKKAQMRVQVRKALAKFESDLSEPRHGIFAQVKRLTDRFNQIYRSDQYPEQVKKGLLDTQRQMIRNGMEKLQQRYYEMLVDLLDAQGLGFIGIVNASQHAREVAIDLSYLALSRSCQSQLCITESALDQAAHISFVDSLFNVELSFKLADDSAVLLERVNMGWEHKLVTEALGSSFPEEFKRLPMEVQPRDWPLISQAARRRSKIFAKMIRQFKDRDPEGQELYLYNSDGIERFEEYFEVLCKMPAQYPSVRSQVAGCLSRQELMTLMGSTDEEPLALIVELFNHFDLERETLWTRIGSGYVGQRWYGRLKHYACEIGQDYEPGYCATIGVEE